jgi:hypothetical protein
MNIPPTLNKYSSLNSTLTACFPDITVLFEGIFLRKRVFEVMGRFLKGNGLTCLKNMY